ncbi:hypothetical protein AUQ37_07630 [Candidatus Methanomethylophilus sp. 1R26]|uniref:hypothetical protein n=1 Tax=Candidatus Methanomethylophilus sp. 1R26 TaxID=1769296 RepID=UPI0007379705|nr:hypothetical protein [Candidatus Methanomethylophilus sp. 1R26]KUE73755.1 hypothetical protein AUQ37_07630 [Candidatus Methanomethylophilus sp. 1R26]
MVKFQISAARAMMPRTRTAAGKKACAPSGPSAVSSIVPLYRWCAYPWRSMSDPLKVIHDARKEQIAMAIPAIANGVSSFG